MDHVKLMERRETKFMLHASQLPALMHLLRPHYRVLDIRGKRIAAYNTLYYDTPELALYTMHHNGRLSRFKVRHRRYDNNGPGYLEVKSRTNTGRTIKNRMIQERDMRQWNGEAIRFLAGNMSLAPLSLQPAVQVAYSRITLVGKEAAERFTIDLGIEFTSQASSRELPHLVIAELKQERAAHSPIAGMMRQLQVREGALSKYCLAIASMYPHVKKNLFKETLMTIQHLNDHGVIAD